MWVSSYVAVTMQLWYTCSYRGSLRTKQRAVYINGDALTKSRVSEMKSLEALNLKLVISWQKSYNYFHKLAQITLREIRH